ncbi:hypothetical protein DTO002I6_8756 [Penicillium roqueforti]|nr:hypothetical protein DTO002I6_8756 [Penicillium roqueforti]
MNSAGRWPPAKATRNPHGVEVKEVLFFEGKFPQLHSISPTFSRSFSSFSQTLHISLSAPSEPRTLSHFTYTSRFSAISKRLAFFGSLRDFLLSSSIACIGAAFISHLKRGKHDNSIFRTFIAFFFIKEALRPL